MIHHSKHPMQYKNGSYLKVENYDHIDKVITLSVPCSQIHLRPTQVRILIKDLERKLAQSKK